MEAKNIEQKEKSIFEEVVKPILKLSFKNMKWSNLKATFKNKNERKLYLLSFFANPAILYFLLHNRYFEMRLDVTYYFVLAAFGFFFNKGIYLFLKEKGCFNFKIKKSKGKLTDCKHEKQLCNALNSMNISFQVAKTNVTEFSTQIYILSDTPIKSILNSERDIAKRMNLEGKNLTISIDRSYFVFDIRNSEQKVYYFDEYIKKVTEKQLKNKELPFVLGINQSTGKMIVSDLLLDDSVLIAGARGSGKSCFVNVLLQSLITFASEMLILILVDFKGNELNQYEKFSNCMFFGEDSHDRVNKMLDELLKEMAIRNKKLAAGRIKNLKDYNEKHAEKLPYIIVLIDELSLICLDDNAELAKKINKKLTTLLNVGRAAGIIVIGAMQRPNAEQIDTNVRANLDAKFVFRVVKKSETQFTDVQGAERLDRGEFIANTRNLDCERFKGLFIDDNKRNFVLEELENKFANGGKKHDILVNLNK